MVKSFRVKTLGTLSTSIILAILSAVSNEGPPSTDHSFTVPEGIVPYVPSLLKTSFKYKSF